MPGGDGLKPESPLELDQGLASCRLDPVLGIEALVEHDEHFTTILDDPVYAAIDPGRVRNIVPLGNGDPRQIWRELIIYTSTKEVGLETRLRQVHIVEYVVDLEEPVVIGPP